MRKLTGALMLVAAATIGAGPASAQVPYPPLAPLAMSAVPGPRIFVTTHRGTFNGDSLRYRASVAETIVEEGGETPAASLFTISYTKEGVSSAGEEKRPLLFVFNGGPGSSSAPLHFALGPKRLASISVPGFADPDARLIDNPLCPLDVTDLVFIDPTDTGFSHTLPGIQPQDFHSVDGDSDSITQLILQWLRSNHRLSSPVYLYGESYGSMRAVALARDLARADGGVRVAGIILGGEAITYGQGGRTFDPVRATLELQMMASVAWHYGKIDDRSQTWRQAVERARQFGQSVYLRALIEGYDLDPTTRERIMQELPAIIGIPESYFQQRNTIRITTQEFEAELLHERGLYVDGMDGLENSRNKPVSDEKTNWDAAFVGLTNTMTRYTTHDLGVRNVGPYEVLTPNAMKVFDQWDFLTSGAPNLSVTLANVVKDNANIRILVMQGRYDTLSQLGVTAYTMDQTDIPRNRVTIAYFDGGHFLIPTREAMAAIHQFVSTPPGRD